VSITPPGGLEKHDPEDIASLSFWIDDLYFVDDATERELNAAGLTDAFVSLMRGQDRVVGQLTKDQQAKLGSIVGHFNFRVAQRELDPVDPRASKLVEQINNETANDKIMTPEQRLRYNVGLSLLLLNSDPHAVVNFLAESVKDGRNPVVFLNGRVGASQANNKWFLPTLTTQTISDRFLKRRVGSNVAGMAMLDLAQSAAIYSSIFRFGAIRLFKAPLGSDENAAKLEGRAVELQQSTRGKLGTTAVVRVVDVETGEEFTLVFSNGDFAPEYNLQQGEYFIRGKSGLHSEENASSYLDELNQGSRTPRYFIKEGGISRNICSRCGNILTNQGFRFGGSYPSFGKNYTPFTRFYRP
jgi:hypothetical protein